MDFNLNASFHQQFPEMHFEDEIFRWNMENEQPYDEEEVRGTPNGDHVNLDGRSSSDMENSPSNQEAEEGDTSEEDMEDEDGDVLGNLTLSIEKRLAVGSELDSLDMTFLLYCEYGRQMGFSVKKGSQKYSSKGGVKSGEVRAKEYLCSYQGTSNSKQTRERLHQYKKQDNRCMCTAKLRVILGSEGKWIVSIFNKEHNHELADKDHSYLLRSARNMSHAQKSLLEALYSAGIRVKDAYRFMEKEAGGRANTGFIRKDAYHHLEKVKKQSKVQDADSKSIVRHFIEKSNKEPLFYWNIQTDDEGRLMNIFFRDARSYIDYELFGDVLSVDTTYKTNKYELKCAPFVGVNHHMKNCLFGLAFISDETTETFEWMFETFLDSMNGKEPDVVYTDQSKAMMNAIDKKFPSSSNKLCQWHINKNAPSHFGRLNGNKVFTNLWFHCMKRCETVEDFENTWSKMMHDYNLSETPWFRKMYKLRKRWANVFTKDKFCAGLHATSRSEVTNKVLKDATKRSGTLFDFVMSYEQIQLEWRQAEGEDDISCLGNPGLLVDKNPVLQHAGMFFTRNVFLSYEYEATHSINIDVVRNRNGVQCESDIEYLVTCVEDPKINRCVTYNTMTSEASCSCFLWERCGVLCQHIFKIYFNHSVKVIPSKYLIRRLSKEAKKRRASEVPSGVDTDIIVEKTGEDWAFNSLVMRNTYDMIKEIKLNREMKEHLLHALDALRDDLVRMGGDGITPPRQKVTGNLRDTAMEPTCRDPVIPPIRRHTNTRLSSHWEKSKKKYKKRQTPDTVEGSHINVRIPRMQRTSSSRFDHASRASSPSTSNIYMPRGVTSSRGPTGFFATQ